MKHQIFISSYRRDFQFLKYALKSCKKFCQGFHDIPVVAVPKPDLALTAEMAGLAHFVVRPDDPNRGMMSSQCAMLCSDIYCPKADFIHLQGSDWLVDETYKASAYLHNGKPVLHRRPYSSIPGDAPSPDHYHQKNWQRGVSMLFKAPVEFEYMNRQPFIYPRPLFAETRKRIEQHARQPWMTYVMNAKKTLFSEQNVLGYVADRWMPDLFHIQLNPILPGATLDKGCVVLNSDPNKPIYTFWSHGGLDYRPNPNQESPREIIERVLGEKVT